MPFCNNCGHENPEGSRFCSQCGTMLPGADRPVAAPGVPGVSDTAMLTPIGSESDTERVDSGDQLSDEDEAAVGALPAGSALLIVQRGPNAGSRFLVDVDVVTAGRHPDSDIFLDDVTVSRRHAEFRREGRSVKVRDVGSLNGTYVNRDRIDEVTLSNGDEVQIGKYRLVYYASSQSFEG
ncbi:MAG TPA: FHA domain-containing protein [Kribbella sp.]|jgi:pSer/pThr/pTyr-binding forkhead associated (FHA) protein